jgi:hypothetical protein
MKSFFLCANRHHFAASRPTCPYPGCTAEVRPTSMDPLQGDIPAFEKLRRLDGDKGTCPVCGRQDVSLTYRGALRSHKGTTEFDLATDGVCSGSHGAPLSTPLPASEPPPAATPTGKHSIRWWAYIDRGRSRRTSSMKDNEYRWDATCSCGWDSDTGGDTMGNVDKLVQEHKR